ncbi:enterotoxin A family protein, partial [Burkholderia pyrrocinia]
MKYFKCLFVVLPLLLGGGGAFAIDKVVVNGEEIAVGAVTYRTAGASQAPDQVRQARGMLPYQMSNFEQLPFSTSLYDHAGAPDVDTSQPDTSRGTNIRSGYVSTTTSLERARMFARGLPNGTGYIYAIRPSRNFVDVNESLRDYSADPSNNELAALGGIRLQQVLGWWRVIRGELSGPFQRNSDYDSGRFDNASPGGARPDLAGFPEGHEAWCEQYWSPYAERTNNTELRKREANGLRNCDAKPRKSAYEAASEFYNRYVLEKEKGELTCCDLSSAALPFPGNGNSQAYFFHGKRYVLVDVKPGTNSDYIINGPKDIASEWPSLRTAGFTSVDAALTNPDDYREAYFFSGTKYVLVRVNPGTNSDYIVVGPKDIASEWPSLRTAGFTSVDAALTNPDDHREAYFFSGTKYVRVRVNPGTNSDYIVVGPKDIASEWPSLRKAGFTSVDAALTNPDDNREAYFFSGTKYVRVRVNPGTNSDYIVVGPKDIASEW